jgi:Protein of unknown function (DUF4038)
VSNQLPPQAGPRRPGPVHIAAALAVLVVAAAGPGAAAADTARSLAGGATAPDRDVQIPALAPVEVSPNGRFLQFTDGRPFFWLADTGWEMFHRASRDDARLYLDTRAEQGFTVIQAVALAEKGGLDVPTPAGHTPLVGNDPARPDVRDGADNDYWDDVDYMIDYANRKGMYVAIWAAWGSMVHDGPEVLNATNARPYGEFLGARYGGKNVFFVLGGDRESHAGGNTPEVWSALAEGIRATDPGNRLISFHPWGEESSTEMFPNSSPVIDFNLIQGSHKKVPFEALTRLIVEDYGKTPVKPVIDSEVFYEEHPFNWDSAEDWKTRCSPVQRATPTATARCTSSGSPAWTRRTRCVTRGRRPSITRAARRCGTSRRSC